MPSPRRLKRCLQAWLPLLLLHEKVPTTLPTITRAKAGRASYISESNLAGHNDPGAEAVARLFEELLQTNDALV